MSEKLCEELLAEAAGHHIGEAIHAALWRPGPEGELSIGLRITEIAEALGEIADGLIKREA